MSALSLSSTDNVLVTGATGFTGAHLVRKLVGLGVNVHAIARESSNRAPLADLPITWHIGEVYDKHTVESACKDINVVFHVAAAFREARVSDDIYRKVHVESTELLIQCLQAQRDSGVPFKRFVHVSTAGVHGHIETPPADESYRFSPGDLYQQTKVDGESLLQQFSEKHQFPFTIIRPCAIYGPGDRRLLKLFKLAKLPVCPILGLKNSGLYHLIHVEDLTQFMVMSSTAENAQGEIFIVGNPSASSIASIIHHIGETLGHAPKLVRIPVSPVMGLAWLCEKLCKPFDIEPPIYPRRVAFFTKDRSFDTRKMQRLPGFQYQYTTESGLSELTQWYKDNNWL